MSIRRVAAGVLVALMLVACTAQTVAAATPCVPGPFASHRGDSAEYTQSTAAAFDGAYAAGSRIWDTDVRFTVGGVPMLLHDPDLGVFGSSRSIATSSYSYVESLRAPDGGQVESLWAFGSQVLAHPDVNRVFVELKTTPTAAQWARLKPRLDRLGGRLIVASFSTVRLKAAKARGYRTALITRAVLAAATVRSYGASAAVEAAVLTPGYASALQTAGVTVYGWTVNTPAQWQALPARVVPIGDDPAAYRDWVCPV